MKRLGFTIMLIFAISICVYSQSSTGDQYLGKWYMTSPEVHVLTIEKGITGFVIYYHYTSGTKDVLPAFLQNDVLMFYNAGAIMPLVISADGNLQYISVSRSGTMVVPLKKK